ncbi:976_t:CDS:1 [Ambispora leptoticha]|uniref:976_t:CDS:1 n=1 Tax=Ambispora leptoticha TaxID=144679 RepID=A0A9N9FBW5_9GLOM|nr:976_t:CDS:1 [Ambispora leptoticha]
MIINRYIYGGVIYLAKYNGAEVLDLLIAADELGLTDLFDFIQNHLISEKADWIREHFALAHKIAYQHESFWKLQQFIQMIKDKHPEVVFKAVDFTALEEDMLVSLISRDDIAIEEIDIWARIMDWGLAQMPPFTFDISQWRQNEFAALEKLLHKLIPHIRFFQISSEDFDERVVPFKSILPRRLYRDVCNYMLHPDDIPKIKSPILPPRLGNWNWLVMNMKPMQIDSILINVKHAALAAIWIDQKNIEAHFVTNPFEFKLLLRGSRDGFTPTSFHRLCDNQGPTLTVIRVKDTDEIIGGYNPYSWNLHSGFERTNDSFIFSIDENDLSASFCSLVSNSSNAVKSHTKCGPSWGDGDLCLFGHNFRESKLCRTRQCDYEQKIRSSSETFSVHEYEVFQVIRTNGMGMNKGY